MGLIESKQEKAQRLEKERIESEIAEDEYNKNKAKERTERTKNDIKKLEAARLITDEILFNFKAMKDTQVNRLLLKSVISNTEKRIRYLHPDCHRDYYYCDCHMCINRYVVKDQIGKYQYDSIRTASIETHQFNIRCIINHSIKPGDILISNRIYSVYYNIIKVLDVEHKYINNLDASPLWYISITYQYLLAIGSDSNDVEHCGNPRIYNPDLLYTPSLESCINQKYNFNMVYSSFNKEFIKVTDEERDEFNELTNKLKKIIHEKRVEVDDENEGIENTKAAGLTINKLDNDRETGYLRHKLDRLYNECMKNYEQLYDQRQNDY